MASSLGLLAYAKGWREIEFLWSHNPFCQIVAPGRAVDGLVVLQGPSPVRDYHFLTQGLVISLRPSPIQRSTPNADVRT
jgi:hypothetical protein